MIHRRAAILIFQFSSGVHAQGLPEDGTTSSVHLYGVTLVIFGLLKSWVCALPGMLNKETS